MRNLTGLGAVVLVATACTSESELRYTATLGVETNGVALSADGLDAHAGMAETTCTIDTNWACPTSDVDLPTDEEKIFDHFGNTTLGASVEGVYLIRGSAWQQDEDLPIASVRGASLLEGGTVMVAGTVTDCRVHRGLELSQEVPAALCEEGSHYAFDRDDGTVFAGTPEGVFRVTLEGWESLDVYGDLIAWDHSLGLLYAATSGDPKVLAIRPNGVTEWSAQASGPITSIAARGEHGEVMVLAEDRDGFGVIERREGETGELLGRSRVPDADGDLVVSENGHTVAVVRNDEVNFFGLDAGGAGPTVDDTPPVCLDLSTREGGMSFGLD
ncbi:MAG TPA: hypothetical protein ENK18_20605 [Deltaproteobacteria bacterium]|nr:hypothetical protein [Deltaproteobacteria bacterium]